jgi:hypothetical protein
LYYRYSTGSRNPGPSSVLPPTSTRFCCKSKNVCIDFMKTCDAFLLSNKSGKDDAIDII